MEPQRACNDHYQARCKIYEALSRLLAKLAPPSPIPLSHDRLRSFHIQCSAMALCPEEDPVSDPLFCSLVPWSTMNKAFESTFTNENTIEWPGYNPRLSSDFYSALAVARTLLEYTISGQFIQEPLVNTDWYATGLVIAFDFVNPRLTCSSQRSSSRALTFHRNDYPNTYRHWGVHHILRVDNTDQPHLACLHVDDAEPEEGLRSSEMISAVKLMKQGMRLDKRGQFRINPV